MAARTVRHQFAYFVVGLYGVFMTIGSASCAPITVETHDTLLWQGEAAHRVRPAPDKTRFDVEARATGGVLQVHATELGMCADEYQQPKRIRRDTTRSAGPYVALELAGGLLWGAAAAYIAERSACNDESGKCHDPNGAEIALFATGVFASPALLVTGTVDSVRAMDTSDELEIVSHSATLISCGSRPAAGRTAVVVFSDGTQVPVTLDSDGAGQTPVPAELLESPGGPSYATINVGGVTYGRIRLR